MDNIPKSIKSSISQAADILKAAGCRECYIFGSVARGKVHAGSDIDLAIRGLPPEKFFSVYGLLPENIDLVDLDEDSFFSRGLLRREVVKRVF